MKRLSYALITTLFLSLIASPLWAQVTVTPDKENHYGRYRLQSNIADQSTAFFGLVIIDPSVKAGSDTFTLTFPSDIGFPSSIASEHVQVKGVDKNGNTNISTVNSAITITDNGGTVDVQFTSPINIGASNSFEIIFAREAKLLNPPTGTSYDIDYDTNVDGQDPTNIGSFSTTANDSEIAQPSVSVNPSYKGFTANYTLNFTTGPGGYMDAGNTITVSFPAGTTVPDGSLSSSSVSVNGTVASSVTGNASARTLQIVTPEVIDNNENITIQITSALGVENPNSTGDYTLDINTTAEPTDVASSTYTIISLSDISIPNVTLLNSDGSLPANTVNSVAAYHVSFRLGTNEDNQLATGDLIEVTFPNGTYVPSTIDATDIEISSDLVDNPSSVSVSGQTVTLTVPYPIGITDEVTLKFAESIGLINPPTANGYSIDLVTKDGGTSAEKDNTTSNSYYLTTPPSNVNVGSVTLSNDAANATSDYDIDFTTGQYGRLVGGLSSITVDFPAGTDLSGVSSVSVNSTGIAGGDYTITSTRLEINLPSSFGTIANSDPVTITVQDAQNPNASSYTLGVFTSAENNTQQSDQYLIGATSITALTTSAGTNLVNNTSSFDVSFTNTSALSWVDRNVTWFFQTPLVQFDYIRVIFPEGTEVPASIATGDVSMTVNGGGYTIDKVETNSANRIVDIYIADTNGADNEDDIAASSNIDISIATTAGITHPSVPTNTYKLKVYTSQDLSAEYDSTYTLNANSASVVAQTATATPNVVGNGSTVSAQYVVPFSTGTYGKLQGGIAAGSNTITVEFPSEIIVPGSIDPSAVKLDGAGISNVSVTGQEVTITVPDGITIDGDQQGAGQQSVIEFLEGAGIENGDEYASIPGSSIDVDVRIKTDAESTYSTETNNLTLIKNSELTLTQIILSQNEKSANSAYTIKFRLGSSGMLSGGDKIQLSFPAGTTIPSFPTSYALINGINPASVAVAGTDLTLTLDAGQTLNTDTDYTLQLYESAGITNPSTTGTYSLDFETLNSSDVTIEGPKTSPTYDVVEPSGGSSGTVTITQPSVSISDITADPSVADYTIDFETGSYGALTAGVSTISIDFDAAYTGNLGAISATVNGTAATTSLTGTTVDITVPASVTIGSETAVTVVITNVTNPVASSYTLDAYTSEETTPISSPSYTISATSNPIVIDSITLDPTSQLVNQPFHLTVQVTPQSNASSITLRLPESTYLNPVTSTAEVTVDNGITLSSVDVSQANSEITFNTGANPDFANGTTYTLEILATSGSRNPKLPTADLAAGNYSISAYTDTEPEITTVTANGTTYDYEILPVTDSGTSQVTILDITTSALGEYNPHNWNWQMETGPYGAIKSGEGYINLIFPADRVNMPASVPKSAITINSLSQPNSVTVDNTSLPGKVILKLVLPANVTVGNNSTISVYIAESSNIYITAPNAKQQAASTQSKPKGNQNTPSTTSTGSDDDDTPSFLADTQTYGASSSSETSPSSGDFNPLPISLTEFTAARNTSTGFVELSWRTATERENYGFEVYRSFIPFSESDIKKREMGNLEWEEFGFVEGNGTTSEQHSYSYVDEEPLEKAGTYLYKLVQVDYDGNTTHFGPAELDIEAPEKFELSQNYPNPFNPTTVIPYAVPEKSNVTIRVFNILGQVVQTLYSGERQPGRYNAKFNGQSLSSGVYLIHFQAGGNVFTKKMMLVK